MSFRLVLKSDALCSPRQLSFLFM